MSQRHRGDITTILDLCDRDEQDDILFPLDSQNTLFSRKIQRCINYVSTINEHTQRGPGEFGQRFVYDIGRQHGDFISGLFIQIKLSHWLTEDAIAIIQKGQGTHPWFYANSLGSAIIAKAELEIDGIVIETIDSDYINIKTLLNSTTNQFGLLSDGIGHAPVQTLLNWPATQPFPTDNRILICPLPFHFFTEEKKELLPVLSMREKSIKVNITLRPFTECIRSNSEIRRSCAHTPLSHTFQVGEQTYTARSQEPEFADLRLLVQGIYIDGPIRQAFIRQPYEYIIRQPHIFHFTEPTKYVTNKSSGDIISVQLPLEINGPIEEIWWIYRRKSARVNNEWTNYSLLSEQQQKYISRDPLTSAPPPIIKATIQINGIELISAKGDYFREHISKKHPGGITAYKSFIYGYSFANSPGKHQPSGSFNASRASTVRLSLDIQTPPPFTVPTPNEWTDEDLRGWEVSVYVIGLNWLRIENGMANRLFSS
jgi:hypothetical protein